MRTLKVFLLCLLYVLFRLAAWAALILVMVWMILAACWAYIDDRCDLIEEEMGKHIRGGTRP